MSILTAVGKSWATSLSRNARSAILIGLGIAVLNVATAMPKAVWAKPDESEICITSARLASERTGVPFHVLQAISLTETGRKSGGVFRPWPWTVNMEGKGDWFDSRAQALAYVDKNFKRGARSFDVGCFQLNYKWHGQAFSSIEQMFDPTENALYAANFLRELYIEKGNWTDAAGAYHSRTPSYANRYKKRFAKLYARLSSDPLPPPANSAPLIQPEQALPSNPVLVARLNNFPLLQRGAFVPASLGSLMPASAGIGSRRLFGGG